MLIKYYKLLMLGIIEALTEFIPVSSTAHLIFISKYMKVNNAEIFEVSIQIGAIFAVIFLYRKKLINILLKMNEQKSYEFVLKVFLAFLPSAIIGLLFYSVIKSLFSITTISISLILGGIIMIFYEKKIYNDRNNIIDISKLSFLQAIKIGLFQVISMIPGVSRSGATILGGMFLNLNRKEAIEFSFFLSIPTIISASIFDIYKNYSLIDTQDICQILFGVSVSFIFSIIIVKWFISFISQNNLIIFGYYRIILGFLLFFNSVM